MELLKAKVLIVGLTSFLGTHVGTELLKSKKYSVRGTVPPMDKEELDKLIKEIFGENHNIEIIEADLLDSDKLY